MNTTEHAGATLHRLSKLVPQASFIAVLGVLFVLKAGRFVRGDLLLGTHLVVLVHHLPRGVELPDQFIYFRGQTEHPVKIVLVRLLLAIGTDFFNACGEFLGVVGHAEGQRQFPFIANARPIDADTGAE